jgi:glycosyltransferase involved in cell wall biosynthesis
MARPTIDTESVAILWNGLPHYAVAAIAAAIQQDQRNIIVISTQLETPTAGFEWSLGRRVHWLPRNSRCSFRGLGERVPAVTFTAGWSVPCFMRLARETRKAGGKVVCMCDNSFRGDLRQVVGAAVYRLKYSRFFDHVWVPGKSGDRLMRFFGVPASRVSQGLYTANTEVFTCTTPIESRPLRFIFAGQFIDRKNVLHLCEAFLRFRREITGPCDLHLYGSGPLRERIPIHPDVHVHPFATPQLLAAALNQSRCLVLPSTVDHWGLVVHEAASCGTLLIVSSATGAAEDLCGRVNSRIVAVSNEDDLVRAFQWAAAHDSQQLAAASLESRQLAAQYSIEGWGNTFRKICDGLVSKPSTS